MRNKRYEILASGPWPLDFVQLEYKSSEVLTVDEEQHRHILAHCQAERAAGRKVEQNPLYRYLAHSLSPQGLRVQSGAVDYETYLGLSREPGAPVVVTVAAATEVEGYLVLERRSQKVAQGRGILHVKPSGHVHPPQTPWEATLAEAEEELAILPHEIVEAHCLGFVRSHTAPCVNLLYSIRTSLAWQDLITRQPVDAWEHDELLPLPIDPDSFATWLRQHFDEGATGPGHATVLLEGRERFGEDWFQPLWTEFI